MSRENRGKHLLKLALRDLENLPASTEELCPYCESRLFMDVKGEYWCSSCRYGQRESESLEKLQATRVERNIEKDKIKKEPKDG